MVAKRLGSEAMTRMSGDNITAWPYPGLPPSQLNLSTLEGWITSGPYTGPLLIQTRAH